MELTLFYLPSCPHCRLALRYIEELQLSDPRYASIKIKLIDESREKALADSFDYWYVPCFFIGHEKLHEGHAEKADVKLVLDKALESR